MTTVRDELVDEARDAEWADDIVDVDETLRILGIDPDLPAEEAKSIVADAAKWREREADPWGDDDRCLAWLRGRGWGLLRTVSYSNGYAVTMQTLGNGGFNEETLTGDGATLRGALIAACEAVQEKA